MNTQDNKQQQDIIINEKNVKNLLSIIDQGLCNGEGKQPVAGQVCIMQAISIAFNLPFNDNPYQCTGKAVRAFDIRLNDCNWSSPTARAKGMRREAIAKLGSNKIDQQLFADYVIIEIIKRILPLAFECLPQTKELDGIIEKCKNIKTKDDGYKISKELQRYADANAAAYAADAAYAAYAADAAYAAYAAADAANAAADAAYAANAAAYTANAAATIKKDSILSLAADIAVEALQAQDCEGCRFLYLL